ncbi:TonB-dependent receptor [Xanthomonas sp. NCPPB 2632]|uniref:TonB-dependent receptor n=1 Tax=Xanthomonas sp. NCPPB 2632 TaxID=3240912 RepID=UPI003517D0D5
MKRQPLFQALGLALLAQGAPFSSAFAQNAAPTEETKPAKPAAATNLGAMVVTGVSAATQRAAAIKRDSDVLIDTTSASDIGELPDFNAGDALKRVAGVNALTYQGEPRFVIVRGFNPNYNDLLIDGFSLASTDINLGQTNTGGRQVSMEVLPSNIASHIDVVKMATPAQDANFIGGLTNFVTPSAFDYPVHAFSATATGGIAEDSSKNGGNHGVGQAQVSGSRQFGDHHQYGIYLSATYWKRDINVPQVEMGGTRNWYNAAGVQTTAYSGNGYAVPSSRVNYNYQNKRDRTGLQGRFDWAISDRFTAFLNAYYFRQNEDSDRNDLNAAVQTGSLNLGQTATSGNLTKVNQTIQLGRYRWKRELGGLYGRFSGELDGGWMVDGGSSWSSSRVDNPQTVDNFAQNGLGFGYDTSGQTPSFAPSNPALANDASRYALGYHREERYRLRENRFDEQLNFSRNTQTTDRGWGVGFGARISAIYQDVSFDRTSWSGAPYTLADVLSGQSLCAFQCDSPIPLISASAADAAFQHYASSEKVTEDTASEAGGTYRTREVVYAGYGQAQYRSGRWLLLGGVRVEATRAGSSSTQATNGTYAPVSASQHYTNVLPSLMAVYDTTESSKLRLGLSKTVSRPTFGSSSLHGGVLNTLSSPATLAVGNPDLKPRQSTNLDIAHDWYVDGGRGIVSVAGFYKWIHDDIFNYGELEQVGGVDVPILVTKSRNTDKIVRAWGGEFGFSDTFHFLPHPFDGLGFSANATLMRASFPVTLSDGSTRRMSSLPEQPNEIYNASIFYDKGPVHGRIAWNHLGWLWDDRYPNFTTAGFYANRYQKPTNNIDLQASYDVDKHFAISLDVLNLTRQGVTDTYGKTQELLQSEWRLPRQVMLSVTFKDL